MKNWIKENWFKVGLLVILVVSIIGAFYWYGWRPSQIRKECYDKARGGSYLSELSKSQTAIDKLYQNCLRSNGLEK